MTKLKMRTGRKRKWRWWRSVRAVTTTAFVASLIFHLRLYNVLGAIETPEDGKSAQAPAPPVSFEIISEPSPPTSPPVSSPASPPASQHRPEAQPQRKVALPKPPQPSEMAKPPNAQAVKQQSQNPDVETPEDPKYLAEENQRVQEETVARVRSYTRNDEAPSLPSARESEREGQEGEAESERVQQAARAPATLTPAPSRLRESEERAASQPSEGTSQPSEGTSQPSERTTSRPSQELPSESREQEIVKDPYGSFSISKRSDSGGKSSGGKSSGGKSSGGKSSGGKGSGSSVKVPGTAGTKLGLSWNKFEDAFGADDLKADRERYAAARKAQRKKLAGGSHKRRWKEFRAAIENFTPNVKPGNQTALNAAASPFANYLTEVHLQIHSLFADDYLAGLPGGSHPANDWSLVTTLEIIVNRDGSVHQIGVVASSGVMQFDYGAFSSVSNAQPFPKPPASILSGDGRAYFHWGFYRNERQCGTFNAEAFILPNPPKGGASPEDDLKRG